MYLLLAALIIIAICAFSGKESTMRAKLNLAILPSFNQSSTVAHSKGLC